MRTDGFTKFFYKWKLDLTVFGSLLFPLVASAVVAFATSTPEALAWGLFGMFIPGLPLAGWMMDRPSKVSGELEHICYIDEDGYHHRPTDEQIGWAMRKAYNNRQGFLGSAHKRYVAALFPGGETGITSLAIGVYEADSNRPHIFHSEMIRVGADMDQAMAEYVIDRFFALQAEARDLEEQDYLEGVPQRKTQAALQAHCQQNSVLEARNCAKQQQILAQLAA